LNKKVIKERQNSILPKMSQPQRTNLKNLANKVKEGYIKTPKMNEL
jgi:hypothetical protein